MQLLQQSFSCFCLFSRTNPCKYWLSSFLLLFFFPLLWNILKPAWQHTWFRFSLIASPKGMQRGWQCRLLHSSVCGWGYRGWGRSEESKETKVISLEDYKINWNSAGSCSGNRKGKSQISLRQKSTSLGNSTVQDFFFNSLILCHIVQQSVPLFLWGWQAIHGPWKWSPVPLCWATGDKKY